MGVIFEYGFLVFSLAWFAVFGYYFLVFVFKMVLPALFFGAPYVQSQDRQIDAMISVAGLKNSQKAVDLGAGDGKIVIALAQKGIEAHGYEINPLLIFKARQQIKKSALQGKAFMHWGNFWNKNLSGFDVIIIYGISFAMGRLEKKLKKEAKPGVKIISNSFIFPGWVPVKKEGNVYLYEH